MRGALGLAALLAGCGFTIDTKTAPDDARVDQALSDDAQVDAATDAMPDGPALTCPSFFRMIGTGTYAVLEPAGFATQHTLCNSYGTHLAVIDSAQELADLVAYGRTVTGVNMNSRFYLGLVQAPLQDEIDTGWIDFFDRDAPDLWAQSGDNEPNDGADHNETNHQEQVGALQLDRAALVDLSTGQNVRAYCECDGKVIGPKALGYLAQPNL